MAKNLKFNVASLEIAVPSGTLSGWPAVLGAVPGVALYDRDADGNAVVDFRQKVWDMSVQAVDDAGNSAVAIGDAIYYAAAGAPTLSKKASGILFGVALEIVATGTTDTIKVLITGAGGDKGGVQYAQAYAKLDLSGAAQAGVPILHAGQALRLVGATFLYTEASSADAGVVVTIGKETDAAFYYTGTSEVSKALWYEKALTLLATAVAAGDTVVCGHAGSKTGTGEILVAVTYVVA